MVIRKTGNLPEEKFTISKNSQHLLLGVEQGSGMHRCIQRLRGLRFQKILARKPNLCRSRRRRRVGLVLHIERKVRGRQCSLQDQMLIKALILAVSGMTRS